MSSIFASCLEEDPTLDKIDTLRPQPFKFKLLNSVSLFSLILRHYAEPNRKQQYNFPRNNLHFLKDEQSHIPVLHFPAVHPSLSLLFVYSHGSGSTLNHVRDFVYAIHLKFGIGAIAYDCSGEGESEKEFVGYEKDIKMVLSWALSLGYRINRTILCGFSLGSYSTLCLEGQMPRILISPICGIYSFVEKEAARYQGQKYDNVALALKIRSQSLVFHCSQQMVDISHGRLITEALARNNHQEVVFHQIKDGDYEHRSAPTYLCSPEGMQALGKFLSEVHEYSKKGETKYETTQVLRQQLLKISFEVVTIVSRQLEKREQGSQQAQRPTSPR